MSTRRATSSLTRLLWILAVLALATILATLLDRRLVAWLATTEPEARARLVGRDWYQFLRAVGYLPTWLVIAGALALLDRRARGIGRGVLVMLAPILAGAIAELVKLVIARERPVRDGVIQNDAAYVWRGLLSGFSDSSNLGMPSSHAAVAFAGAAMLGILFPPLRWLMLALAAGCGLTRLLTGAHFASDVVVGASIGVLTAWALGALARPGGSDSGAYTRR
ncbi:MAG: phosphatase PAP2 family protein [Phycisphaerales bacterium]